MAKAIKITQELVDKAVAEFREKLMKIKSTNGTIKYETSLSSKTTTKAQLTFTDKAVYKMKTLLDSFSGEVGWYGLVDRAGSSFLVDDILVYPQEVTGATVTTDEKTLSAWYDTLSDDEFNRKRFQGHSHVNFAPSPSGTDIADREIKLAELEDGDFFIFMIINKRMEYTVDIYDTATNTHYETNDVDVVFGEEAMDFYKNMEVVKTKVYTVPAYPTYPTYNTKTVADYKRESGLTQVLSQKDKENELPFESYKSKKKWTPGYDYYDRFTQQYGDMYD